MELRIQVKIKNQLKHLILKWNTKQVHGKLKTYQKVKKKENLILLKKFQILLKRTFRNKLGVKWACWNHISLRAILFKSFQCCEKATLFVKKYHKQLRLKTKVLIFILIMKVKSSVHHTTRTFMMGKEVHQ
jgi:hypothetical protein